MEHSFDIKIAEDYNVNIAIIVKNFDFWLSKNKANGKNFKDGRYWTYNSVEAFSKLFPYFTARQLNHALKKMEELSIIDTGYFNSNSYNRTKWYTFSEKFAVSYAPILQFCQMDVTEMENGNDNNVKSLYTDSKPDKKPNAGETPLKQKRFKKPTIEEIQQYLAERKITAFTANKFFDNYESKGWMIGKNKMKDWKAAVRTWERNDFGQQQPQRQESKIIPDLSQQ